jgi:hypothetical protein
MSDPAKEDAKRRALHEAAHAIVGMAFGLKLVRVTVEGDGVAEFEHREQKARVPTAMGMVGAEGATIVCPKLVRRSEGQVSERGLERLGNRVSRSMLPGCHCPRRSVARSCRPPTSEGCNERRPAPNATANHPDLSHPANLASKSVLTPS